MLDLKLSNVAAVKAGAIKDDGLKRLNEREANAWAAQLRSTFRKQKNWLFRSSMNRTKSGSSRSKHCPPRPEQ